MKNLKLGTIITPRWFVPGHPISLLTDTRCVVKERKGGRYRVERDDGRQGSWWLDRESMRVYGEES